MTSLRQIKDRIRGVQSTKQVTSSMKVVALARLKKLHQAFTKTDIYFLEITRMVRRLLRAVSDEQDERNANSIDGVNLIPPVLSGRGKEDVFMVAVLTSDDGLSGMSNMQVVEKAHEVITYLEAEKKTVRVVCLGTKGADFLRRIYPDRNFIVFPRKANKNKSLYADAENLVAHLLKAFDEERFDVCVCIHNRFKSIVSQKPTIEQLIPNRLFADDNPWQFLITRKLPDYMKKDFLGHQQVALKDSSFLKAFGGVFMLKAFGEIDERLMQEATRDPWVYDYDPDAEENLNKVLPQYLTACVYRMLLESDVSDNAARLMAMDNSTRNANQMLDMLRKKYASTRQNLITTDLVERTGATITPDKKR